MLGVPAHALAAIAELGHQRSERGETLVEVGIVALDHGHRRHGLAGDRIDLALLPVLDVERLRDLAGGVVQDRRQHHVLFDAEHFRRDLRERLGDALVDVPVVARLPDRIDRRGQRMDEGMHVGGVEVVLLVPGRGRQHDVGIHAGRGHAEIERHQQVELSFRRLIVPDDFARLFLAVLAEVLAHHAVLGAEQMLEKILVALARRAEQIGAPDEQVARPVCRIVRVVAGKLQFARFQRLGDVVLGFEARRGGLLGDVERIGLQAAAPTAASPCARRARCSRSARRPTGPPARSAKEFPTRRASRSATGRCARRRPRSNSSAAAAGSSRGRRRAAASRSAGAAFPGRHNATSRRPTGRRIRTSPAC